MFIVPFFDQEEKYGLFFIELKVIHKKGIILNRIRLSANYTCEETIAGDIEVFGENKGRGYGILLNSLINFAVVNSIKNISGWISYADKNHFDKLDYFNKKHSFNVIWCRDSLQIKPQTLFGLILKNSEREGIASEGN
ncbi:MAG: hypothetical protein AB2392_22010 [Neobacillus sp.]